MKITKVNGKFNLCTETGKLLGTFDTINEAIAFKKEKITICGHYSQEETIVEKTIHLLAKNGNGDIQHNRNILTVCGMIRPSCFSKNVAVFARNKQLVNCEKCLKS